MRPPGPDDLRTPAQRRADALVELARLHLSAGRPAHGRWRAAADRDTRDPVDAAVRQRPEATGTASAGAQAAGTHGPPSTPCCGPSAPATCGSVGAVGDWAVAGAAMGALGHEIPPELAQRLTCDGEVWRAVLDPGTGLPLEVGRAHRVVPYWIRKALHARDRGCRWPGCDAPAAWTDAHHLLAWWLGGLTDVDNLHSALPVAPHEGPRGSWQLDLDPTTGDCDRHPARWPTLRARAEPGVREPRPARRSG